MLVDNASLDIILRWQEPDLARFRAAIANSTLVIYLAPETCAELLAIGATKRSDRLSPLASLVLTLFNGRLLNYHFWMILDEVAGRSSRPYLSKREANHLIDNLKHYARGGSPPTSDWFQQGANMISREKENDKQWRTGFQKMYRARDRETVPHQSDTPLCKFSESQTVKELVRSRVKAICVEAKRSDPTARASLRDPGKRASEILESNFAFCPALALHLSIRIARLWWYTEYTVNGRKVEPDLFDDALLHYLNIHELDLLVTPDRALSDFAKVVFPKKQVLSPDCFLRQYISSA